MSPPHPNPIRFGGIDPVEDVGLGVPTFCERCHEPIEPVLHPTFHAGRFTSLQGLQWTCDCSTWGAVA